jgi:branched-chain amino acid transport system permease protein
MPNETTAATGTKTPGVRRLPAGGLLLALASIGAALLSVPLWGSSGLMHTLVEFISLLALAHMWNLLAGYAGLVSVGQQAWLGLGGYALLVLADDLKVNLLLSVLIAGLFAALVALPAAALLFRLRAGYFAIGTWVMAEVFRLLVASSTNWLKGGLGRTLLAAGAMDPALRQDLTYWLAVFVGLGAMFLVTTVMRSRLGLGLTALRDSETAAASAGVNTTWVKLLVYVVCAFGTGIAGALIYLNALRITPDAAFSVQWTAFMIFIVVIGGIGTVEGPVLGAILFFSLREYLSNFGSWYLILLGVIAIAIMLAAPHGLWGLLHERFGLELVPIRRRLPRSDSSGN